jgi:hypothetical protein
MAHYGIELDNKKIQLFNVQYRSLYMSHADYLP